MEDVKKDLEHYLADDKQDKYKKNAVHLCSVLKKMASSGSNTFNSCSNSRRGGTSCNSCDRYDAAR